MLTHLHPLDRKALRAILTEPKNAIIKQYIKLFSMDNIELTFTDEVLDYIVDKAVEFKLGARGLQVNMRSYHARCNVRTSLAGDKRIYSHNRVRYP
ncbi:MAG: hypothetical protein MZV63_24700 [Marinilabiliales bacterium]|nr:hypothetical protein [Marinilabiliales bacterium]